MPQKQDAPAATGAPHLEASMRSPQQEYSTNLDLALILAERGWHVFPCHPGPDPKRIKRPFTKRGKDDATTDQAQIKAWWSHWPNALVGVYCEKSGIFAVDLDRKNGVDGLGSWRELAAKHGEQPGVVCGPIQDTPSGGQHLIFRLPENLAIPNNASKLAPGIDLRSNGYICTGGKYIWLDGHGPTTKLSDAPAWLLEEIQAMTNNPSPNTKSSGKTIPNQNDQVAWAASLLERLSPWRCDDYDCWIRVGMALADLGDPGLALWDAWSQRSPKYNPGECSAKWKSFKPGDGVSLGTLYHMAEEDNPTTRVPGALAKNDDASCRSARVYPQEGQIESLMDDQIAYSPNDIFIPDLPKEARISDKLLAQSESAGTWITDYVNFASKAAPMSAPEFHQILGLILVSTSVARRVRIRASTDEIFPNLYALIVGSSGDKKSTATRLASKVLRQSGLYPLALPGYMSPQGLLAELIGKQDAGFTMDDDARAAWKIRQSFPAQRLLMIDEAAVIFEYFGQQSMAGLKSLILRLYDCPEDEGENTVARGYNTAKNCYLNICGISTPTDLAPFLKTAVHWGNGVWPRFVFVTPSWERPPYRFYPPEIPVPPDIPNRLKALFERLPQPKEQKPPEAIDAALAPGVWEMWDAYYKAIGYDLVFGKELSPRYHASYKRLHMHAMKAAILYACVDWATSKLTKPKIELAHYVKGQVFAEQCRMSLHRLLETPNKDGQEESLDDKVFRRIPPSNSGIVITTRELSIALNMSDQEERFKLDRLLDLMVTDGRIQSKKIPGRKVAGWCRV